MPKASSKLKALRLEAKLSQNHLARLADLDRSSVSAAERGREVTDLTLEKLVNALGDALSQSLIVDDVIFVDQPRSIGPQSISIPSYVVDRIRKRISDIGLSKHDLSKRTGLSPATLNSLLRSKSNIRVRRGTIQEIARALDFSWSELMRPPTSVGPRIPAQTRSVHFTIRDGLVATVPTQDFGPDENDYRRLAALQTPLLQASKTSQAELSKNNKPFAALLDITENYLGELDKDVHEINYAVLYAYGLQLAVAYESTEELIKKGELPDFDLDALTSTRSVLQLHGPFILSSRDGRDLVTDAERYERNPTEERQFQADVKQFGDILRERDDLIEEKAGEFISDITAPDDGSEQFERRYIFTKGAAKNLVIVFSAGALVASTAFIPVVGPVVAASLGLLTVEAMKKSKPFIDLSAPIRKSLDDLSEVELQRLKQIPREQLQKMREFVLNNQDILRRVGGSAREMQWFRDVLDWITSDAISPEHKQLRQQRSEALHIYHLDDEWEQFCTLPNNLFDLFYQRLGPEKRAKLDFQEYVRDNNSARANYCWKTTIDDAVQFEYKFFNDSQNLISEITSDEANNSVIIIDMMAFNSSGVPITVGAQAIQKIRDTQIDSDIIVFSAYPDLIKEKFIDGQDNVTFIRKDDIDKFLTALLTRLN